MTRCSPPAAPTPPFTTRSSPGPPSTSTSTWPDPVPPSRGRVGGQSVQQVAEPSELAFVEAGAQLLVEGEHAAEQREEQRVARLRELDLVDPTVVAVAAAG